MVRLCQDKKKKSQGKKQKKKDKKKKKKGKNAKRKSKAKGDDEDAATKALREAKVQDQKLATQSKGVGSLLPP